MLHLAAQPALEQLSRERVDRRVGLPAPPAALLCVLQGVHAEPAAHAGVVARFESTAADVADELEHAVNALIVTLLESFTQGGSVPLLCVIDEALYIDPPSWRVMLRVATELDSVLTVLAARPLSHMRKVIELKGGNFYEE